MAGRSPLAGVDVLTRTLTHLSSITAWAGLKILACNCGWWLPGWPCDPVVDEDWSAFDLLAEHRLVCVGAAVVSPVELCSPSLDAATTGAAVPSGPSPQPPEEGLPDSRVLARQGARLVGSAAQTCSTRRGAAPAGKLGTGIDLAPGRESR